MRSSSTRRSASPSDANFDEGKHTFALVYSQGLVVAGKGGVDPFSGAWMPIDESQWTRLGGGNARLGDSSVLGTEVLHPSGAAQIVVGPLGGEHYKVFTPGGAGHGLVRALTEGFTPEPIHYDLVLEIEDMSYPPGILGLRRLGEDLWLARSDRKGVNTRMVVAV